MLAAVVMALVALAIAVVALWESPDSSRDPGRAAPPAETSPNSRGKRTSADDPARTDDASDTEDVAESVDPSDATALSVTLTGFVFDEQHRPVGAGIEVRREEPSDAATQTLADGSWRLRLQLRKSELEQALFVRARDPQTGAESAVGGVAIDRRGWPSTVFLRLRPSLVVRGRVVDAGGAPVTGATVRLLADAEPAVGVPSWAGNEGADRTVERSTDADGSFAIGVARSGRVRVAARSPQAAALGPSRWWPLPSAGDLDVGDIRLAGAAATTWRLRFVDPEGTPATSVRVRFGQEGSFLLPEPDSAHSLPELLTDGDGRVEVSLGVTTEPLWVAVGSTEYETRFLRLDRTVAGIRDAELTLAPRATLRVKLVHPALSTLIEGGVELVTNLRARTAVSPTDGLDAATGGRAAVPEGLPLWRLLERSITWVEHHPTADGLCRVRVPRGAELALTVRVGNYNLTTLETAISRNLDVTDVEIDLGDGRPILVDWGVWARTGRTESRPETWLSDLAAWPFDADLVEESETGLGLLSREVSVARASDRSSVLWLEPGVDSVAFGFVEHGARLHGGCVVIHELGRRQVAQGDARVSPPTIETPDPAARLVRVRVPYGDGVAPEGIPVHVRRRSSSDDPRGTPRGSRDAPTNSDGIAVLRLVPGSYRVGVFPEYRLGPSTDDAVLVPLEVPPGDTPLEVTLPPLR